MRSAGYFNVMAEQCRGLLKLAADRQLIDQLRLWISDFEADAATAQEVGGPEQSVGQGAAPSS